MDKSKRCSKCGELVNKLVENEPTFKRWVCPCGNESYTQIIPDENLNDEIKNQMDVVDVKNQLR